MCASPLSLLRSGPPPPKVALLPDALFFTRAVTVAPGTPPAEVPALIEIALESVSPFPLAQLYYGFYWKPESAHALVFAAYRRRFTADQTAEWEGSELIVPRFAAVFGAAEVKPATTIVLSAEDGFTAVHWEAGPVPASVTFKFIPPPPEGVEEPPEKREADRAAVREALLAEVGGTRTVIDLTEPPAAQPNDDDEIVFRAGQVESKFDHELLPSLDVRDKAELAQLGRDKRRDLVLWRVLAGCVAAMGLLLLGQIGLWIGEDFWQKARKLTIASQESLVTRITDSQRLAQRIEDLSTKRLLPWEMFDVLVAKMPNEIWFVRASVSISRDGAPTVAADAQTSNVGTIQIYQTALIAQPEVERVEFKPPQTTPNGATFQMTVTFKQKQLKPSDA